MTNELKITVRNLCGFDLNKASQELDAGNWSEEGAATPPDTISNSAVATFSCAAKDAVSDVTGAVRYQCMAGMFEIQFAYAFMRTPSIVIQSPPTYVSDVIAAPTGGGDGPSAFRVVLEPPE